MAITAGTSWYAPIDFGVSEGVSSLLGFQVGAYNPAQAPGQGLDTSLSNERVATLNSGGAINPGGTASFSTYNDPNNFTSSGGAATSGGSTAPTFQTPSDPTGGNIMDEINNIYNATMGIADDSESAIRGAQPGVEDSINRSATQSTSVANSQKAEGDRTIQQADISAQKRFQNAIADARQALSEAGIGFQQRFGRASDIGKALGEYATVNFQRAASTTKDALENTQNTIMNAKLKLEDDYKNTLVQIDNWKTDQLNQVRSTFQNQLLAISQMRAGAEGDRSAQRIAALQNLSAQIQQIRTVALQYATQAGQNANQMMAQMTDQINRQLPQYGIQAQGADTGLGNTIANTNLGQPKVQSAGSVNPLAYTGSIKRKEDLV